MPAGLSQYFHKYITVLKSLPSLRAFTHRQAPPSKARTVAPDGVLPRRDSPFSKGGKGDFQEEPI